MASNEIQENFDSDISVLLQDKQRLQEEIESFKHRFNLLETELRSTKKDNYKYEDLLNKFNEQAQENEEFQKRIAILQRELSENADLKLILSNQQMNVTHLTEELKQNREIITNIEQILPGNSSVNLIERVQQLLNEHQKIKQEINNKQSTGSIIFQFSSNFSFDR